MFKTIKKLFRINRPETKQLVNSVGAPNNLFQNNVGVDLAINMNLFYKMYRWNSDVNRCIQEIQQAISGQYILQAETNNWFETIQDLTIDAVLNGNSQFSHLKNEVLKHLIVSGNIFILKERNVRGQVIAYKVLDTRYISVITDEEYNVVRYTYYDPKVNKQMVIGTEEVFHYKTISDPDNLIYGLSSLEWVAYDVMSDREASISNYYFFQNDALPSALYVLESGLSVDEQKAVMESIRVQLEWSHNKHKNLASANIVDIKQMNQSHKDMDFLEQRKYTTERICASLWVPKIILNYTDGVNYSNANTQYKKFVNNTILPYAESLTAIFTKLINEDFADWYVIKIDTNILDDIESKTDVAIKNITEWIWTRNEARNFLWYDVIEDDIMNTPTVPANTMLIDDLAVVDPTLRINKPTNG